MSTRRCLSKRYLRDWRCVRPASTSMPPSAVEDTPRGFSRSSAATGRWSRSIAIRPRLRPAVCGLPRKGGFAWCTGNSPSLPRSVRAHSTRTHCEGILFDLGVASPQLDDAQRGFSFNKDGPLDMRMDPTRGQPVSAWLGDASFDEIRRVIASLGEERFASRIAAEILRTRATQPLTRTLDLAELVARCVRTREPGKHPATRTFQALRMYINDELTQLQRGLEQALALLAPAGRLAVISFHSLEDRLVKHFIRDHSEIDPVLARLPLPPPASLPPLRRVGRKQKASAAELAANPRARSAVLRIAERRP